ncbi:hypothetical protein [Paraburkholderia atlantica]|uniref:hypothetical protein n=1 Tax=Paraburkholderia atlantica TaxID=2654982 RepID=UPI00161DD604|nr:hypothetical protein [Paraburkholderia atlantica]MBB5508454.1 hypothetical protein [Paraburkholderia atlantica]
MRRRLFLHRAALFEQVSLVIGHINLVRDQMRDGDEDLNWNFVEWATSPKELAGRATILHVVEPKSCIHLGGGNSSRIVSARVDAAAECDLFGPRGLD